MSDLERRHAALVDRDRWVGLEAEAEAARAHAVRLQSELDVARARLARKNARIKELAERVRELEQVKASGVVGLPARIVRAARRR